MPRRGMTKTGRHVLETGRRVTALRRLLQVLLPLELLQRRLAEQELALQLQLQLLLRRQEGLAGGRPYPRGNPALGSDPCSLAVETGTATECFVHVTHGGGDLLRPCQRDPATYKSVLLCQRDPARTESRPRQIHDRGVSNFGQHLYRSTKVFIVDANLKIEICEIFCSDVHVPLDTDVRVPRPPRHDGNGTKINPRNDRKCSAETHLPVDGVGEKRLRN